MKFRFVGGLDCPEWTLSQIPEIAKTDPKTLQELGTWIIDKTKAKQTEWTEADIKKFCSGQQQMSVDGLRALKAEIAALFFIFEKSTKNDCSPKDLGKELLQLGLPLDHACVLLELYDANRLALGQSLAGPALKAPPLTMVKKEQIVVADGGEPWTKENGNHFRMHTMCSDGTTPATTLVIDQEQMGQLKMCMEDAVKQLKSLTES